MGKRKGHLDASVFENMKERYQECNRMLNGLEKNLESSPPESARKWVRESSVTYEAQPPAGYPESAPDL